MSSQQIGQKSPKKDSRLRVVGNRKTSGGGAGADLRKKSSSGSNIAQLVPSGCSLKDLAASDNGAVPVFVRLCVDFIEREGGLTMEGIYRVPGNQAQVSMLEQKFVETGDIPWQEVDLPVNAVATSLKNFFASLPDPLISQNLFDNVVRALSGGRDEEGKVLRLRNIMRKLPHENRAVLQFFTNHLRKVAQHAHINSMDQRNLSKCWWPTLLRPHFDNFEMMAQLTPKLEEFTLLLLKHSDLLLTAH